MGLRRLRSDESRAVTRESFQQAWASDDDWGRGSTLAGASITQLTSLHIGAVYAAVRLYADTLSTLPAGGFVRDGAYRRPLTPEPGWMTEPDVGVSWDEYVQMGVVSLLLDGNWFSRIFRNGAGDVVALIVLDPSRVTVQRNPRTGEVEYVWDGSVTINRRDMLHITELRLAGRLRGESRIEHMKQTLGLAQALTDFSAMFFGNGSSTTGVIEVPAVLSREQAATVQDTWESSHRGLRRSHRVGVLGGGGHFAKTGVDPEDSQLLESRKFAVEEVARGFGVPPHKLGIVEPGAMSYASVEQNNIEWAKGPIRVYARKIETAHNRLLRPDQAYMLLNLDGMLRGDMASRSAAYNAGLLSGYYSINDVRAIEDLPPVAGGDVYRVPLSNINIDAAGVVGQETKVSMAVALIEAGADPEQTLSALGLPPLTFTSPSTQGSTP